MPATKSGNRGGHHAHKSSDKGSGPFKGDKIEVIFSLD